MVYQIIKLVLTCKIKPGTILPITLTSYTLYKLGVCFVHVHLCVIVGELCELPCNLGQNNTVSSNLHLQVYGAEKMQM